MPCHKRHAYALTLQIVILSRIELAYYDKNLNSSSMVLHTLLELTWKAYVFLSKNMKTRFFKTYSNVITWNYFTLSKIAQTNIAQKYLNFLSSILFTKTFILQIKTAFYVIAHWLIRVIKDFF